MNEIPMETSRTAHPLVAWLKPRFRETTLVLLCVAEIVVFGLMESSFLRPSNLLDATRYMTEAGLLAFGMSLVIRTGGIDLSVGSTLALVSVCIGLFVRADMSVASAIVLGLAIGALCGAFNGVLVAHLGLVPLIVTVGTMALFRGIAYAITGANSYSGFPLSFEELSSAKIGLLPIQFFFFAFIATLVWFAMHRSRFGRYVSGIGYSIEASRYSGVRVRMVVVSVYLLSGVCAAMAAVLYTSRVFSARADAALGIEMSAITAVVLGGASITGGRGSVSGTLIAVVLLTYLQNGLIISGIPGEVQGVVIGAALLLGVLFNTFMERRRITSR